MVEIPIEKKLEFCSEKNSLLLSKYLGTMVPGTTYIIIKIDNNNNNNMMQTMRRGTRRRFVKLRGT